MRRQPTRLLEPIQRTRLATERGGLLLLWLWSLSTVILAMTLAYFPVLRATTIMSSRLFRMEQALLLADAGLERGVWELQTGGVSALGAVAAAPGELIACDGLDGTPGDGTLDNNDNNPLAITSCVRTPPQSLEARDNFGGVIGEYDVSIINAGTPPVRIIARSYLPARTDATATSQTAVLDMTGTTSAPLPPIYGGMGVQLVGNAPVFIDSYNSDDGPYGGTNIHSNGNIGTNGSNPNLWPADLYIENPFTVVQGTGTYKTGETIQIAAGATITGGVTPGPGLPVGTPPEVIIPSSLTSLPITTTLGQPGITETGTGHFSLGMGTTYTCTTPMRIRSLYLGQGTFELANGCQLFIDSTGSSPAFKPIALNNGSNGIGLDTDGGQLVKTGTGPTQIFVRDTSVDLDGNGLHYADNVPVGQRRPINLQIYVTYDHTRDCNISGNCNRNSWGTSLRQQTDFYGVIYMEGSGGSLWNGRASTMQLDRSSAGGASASSQYYGMFVTSGGLSAWGEGSLGQWVGGYWECCDENDEEYLVGATWVPAPPGSGGYSPHLHVDEALNGFILDGSGLPPPPSGGPSAGPLQIKSGSWSVRTTHH